MPDRDVHGSGGAGDVTAPDAQREGTRFATPFDPALVLPHRAPFLLLSEVTSVTPGERATGSWHVRCRRGVLQRPLPGPPDRSRRALVESLAQLGAAAVLLDERFAGTLPLFGGIDRARFRRQVRAR